MKCFVTGATGFVGGHLVERLTHDGHEVLALARADSQTRLLKDTGAQIVRGDMDAINIFARHAGEVDVVFHLAAVTRAVRPSHFFRVNTRGTANLMEGLRRGAFRGRVVLLSSLAAGGPAKDLETPRREGDADAPVSNYGRSKQRAEKVLQKDIPEGCDWVALRPGAIYGPREHEIFQVLKLMARRGLTVRIGDEVHTQMTHVEDVVDGMVRAAMTKEAGGKTYYLTDSTVWPFGRIVELAGEYLGRPVRTLRLPLWTGRLLAGLMDGLGRLRGRPVSPLGRDKLDELSGRFWHADSSRVHDELGWNPKWTFQEGFRQTIEWYRESGWL